MKVHETLLHCSKGDEKAEMEIKLIGVVEAAQMLCISTKTLRNLVKTGKIPASDIGNKWLFKIEDITNYIEASKIKPSESEEKEKKHED